MLAIPSALSVGYSFTDWSGISTKAAFVGLDNYAALLGGAVPVTSGNVHLNA